MILRFTVEIETNHNLLLFIISSCKNMSQTTDTEIN